MDKTLELSIHCLLVDRGKTLSNSTMYYKSVGVTIICHHQRV